MVFSYCNIFSAFIQSNDSGTNWREECNKKFFSYITGWRAKFFTSKITKKVKVLSSSPLFFLNCWVNISDNRGIVASEDNKKIPRRKLATAQQRVKMCRKTQHEENSQQRIYFLETWKVYKYMFVIHFCKNFSTYTLVTRSPIYIIIYLPNYGYLVHCIV